MSFLILTKAQAEAVRGETIKGHALQPVELADGTYALPDAVLRDGAHAKHLAFLSGMRRKDAVVSKVVEE